MGTRACPHTGGPVCRTSGRQTSSEVLSIFAFATTTSFTSSSSFQVICHDNPQHSHINTFNSNSSSDGPTATSTHILSFHYAYPFDLQSVCLKTPVCSSSSSSAQADVCLTSGAKASAEFYVFVGVVVMLYCLAALILYIFFDDLYRKDSRIITGDFLVSVVLTALWLISSSAWAAGVIFGFLNSVVWLGNLWFLYKETPWFKVQSKPALTPGRPSDLPLHLGIDLDPHKV